MLPLDQFYMASFLKSLLQFTRHHQIAFPFFEDYAAIDDYVESKDYLAIEQLVEEAIIYLQQKSKLDGLGLHLAPHSGFSQAGVLGHLMQSAPTVLQANQLGAHYFSANNSLLEITMEAVEGEVICAYQIKSDVVLNSQVVQETMLQFAMAMAYQENCKLIGQQIPLTSLSFSFDEVKKETISSFFLSDQVAFNQAHSRICFEEKWLTKNIISYNKELFEVLQQHVQQHFEAKPSSYTSKIKKIITQLFQNRKSVSIEVVAKEELSSVRSLQRNLAEENTTFRQLVEECRSELAPELLEQKEVPIQEIAFYLGYQNNSSFSKAFKRWKGLSPLQYRQQVKKT